MFSVYVEGRGTSASVYSLSIVVSPSGHTVTCYEHRMNAGLCIQKFPDWVDNEINNNKHLLRSNTKGYGGKNH
jgi:hypothetical protein